MQQASKQLNLLPLPMYELVAFLVLTEHSGSISITIVTLSHDFDGRARRALHIYFGLEMCRVTGLTGF